MMLHDDEVNIIAKSLSGILKTADNSVLWTDFLAVEDKQLVLVGFINGRVRFADVTDKNPFKASIFVMKCMEDLSFDEQFLNERQLLPYKIKIEELLEERNSAYDEIMLYIKRREVSCYDLSSVIAWGQEKGYFPEFVADIKGNPLLISGTFEQMLGSRDITTYDLLQFREKIKEIRKERRSDMDYLSV